MATFSGLFGTEDEELRVTLKGRWRATGHGQTGADDFLKWQAASLTLTFRTSFFGSSVHHHLRGRLTELERPPAIVVRIESEFRDNGVWEIWETANAGWVNLNEGRDWEYPALFDLILQQLRRYDYIGPDEPVAVRVDEHFSFAVFNDESAEPYYFVDLNYEHDLSRHFNFADLQKLAAGQSVGLQPALVSGTKRLLLDEFRADKASQAAVRVFMDQLLERGFSPE